MNRADRAKQFLPFDSMKGLSEALRAQEEALAQTERREMSEEDEAALSRALSKLERGDAVSVTYYHRGRYVRKSGVIESFDPAYKRMKIGGERIFFEDISEIKDLPIGGENGTF